MRFLILALFSCLSVAALSQPVAALFDDSERLEGKIIVKIGDLKRTECPPLGEYDCTMWPMDLFRIDDVCTRIHGDYGFGFGEVAMIASDSNKTITIFAIESSGLSAKIRMYRVSLYRCPELF
jgi:hypothetical protein